MRSPPVDVEVADVSVTDATTLILSPINMLGKAQTFALWVINNGVHPVTVTFESSPDGSTPDVDSGAVEIPAGRSYTLPQVNSMRRWWAITGVAPAGQTVSVRRGVTIFR